METFCVSHDEGSKQEMLIKPVGKGSKELSAEVGLVAWNLTRELLFLSLRSQTKKESSHLYFKLALNTLGKKYLYTQQTSHPDTSLGW